MGDIAYFGGGVFHKRCPRCQGSGVEPDDQLVHAGLVLRNCRSGKVWAVYGSYPEHEWGLHRMIPSRAGFGHYVWQIIVRPERELVDARRWAAVGFGDAWDHKLMEADPLLGAATGLRSSSASPAERMRA